MPQERLRLLPAMRNRINGFTIIEVLFVCAILAIIMAIFLYTMSAGQVSFSANSAKAELQAEVRRSIDWIIKDVHQSVSWEIANNNPTSSYIKFRQVTGWDTVNNTFLLSDYYIEYNYDATAKTITRRTSDLNNSTIGSWTLNYVTASPFFTINSSGAIVGLNKSDLLTSKKLIITVSGLKQVLGAQNTTYSLTEEVMIRNG
jgi:prepilin-type N-terminal cleavage/methylation domain-containing protein